MNNCFLQERLNSTVGNVSEIIELVSKYDWDFDNYLEEDVPAAVRCCFVFSPCEPLAFFQASFEMLHIVVLLERQKEGENKQVTSL